MNVIEAVLEARKEIPTLEADKTASISGSKGSFKFSYASLEELLNVVVPILNKHGVLLTQAVKSSEEKPTLVGVETLLQVAEDESHISSGTLHFTTDGTMRDLAGKVTSAKRVQLVALLGLVVSDEATPLNANSQQNWRSEARREPPPAPPADPLAAHRAAVGKGNVKGRIETTELQTLRMRLQQADRAGGGHMPVVPGEGKRISMYDYLVQHVDEVTLSYLYGRVVTRETPPAAASNFFVVELQEGKHRPELLAEAKRLARA